MAQLPVADVYRRGRLTAAVLDRLAEELADTGYSLLLADRHAQLTDVRVGRSGLRARLERDGAVLGGRWLEETTGTNSIATSHELRRGVTVRGEEHYLEALKKYTCYGRPVLSPVNRRLEGVVDVTCLATDDHPLLGPLLDRAVREIEDILRAGAGLADQRLLAAFQLASASTASARTTPVLALGDKAGGGGRGVQDAADPLGLPLSPPALLRYYAGLILSGGTEETRAALFGGRTLVRRTPIGVVAGIAPWNFRATLTSFKYAPALAAGCTIALKPSPETVLDSYLLAEAVIEADLVPGTVDIVPGGRETGAHLVSHPDVDKVAFTGSTAVGRSIAETYGRLLRPVTLEPGGKSATIILDDAQLDLAALAEKLFMATLVNNGQTCFLGTRVLAPRSRYAEFVDLFTAFAGSLEIGDVLDETTQSAPWPPPTTVTGSSPT